MAITVSNWTWARQAVGTSYAVNGGLVVVFTEANVDADFWTKVQNGGGDVRACLDDAGVNELPIHVVTCNTSTQKLVVWVRFPNYTTTAADRTCYLFAGNAGASAYAVTATFGRNNVYQDNVSWYNLEDNSGTDSAGNNPLGTGTTITVTGQVGNAQNFDGNDVYDAAFTGLSGTARRISFWIKTADNNTDRYVSTWEAAGVGNYTAIIIGYQDGNLNIFDGGYPTGNAADTQIPISINTWHKIDYTFDGTTIRGYKDGALVNSNAATLRTGAADNLRLGSSAGTNFFTGDLDEYLVSNSAGSAALISAEYTNQSTPSTFWTMGASYDPSAGGAVTVSLSSAAYSYSGQPANIDVTGEIIASLNSASFSYTGNPATIDLTGEIAPPLSVSSFSYSGHPVNVETTLSVNLGVTSYSYSQQNANVNLTANVELSFQSYSYSQQPATITAQGEIAIDAGFTNYSYSVSPATVTVVIPYMPTPSKTIRLDPVNRRISTQPRNRKIAIQPRKRKIFLN